MFAGDPAPFVMELPQYHLPAPKGVLIHMWERCKAFIIKAGTVIFVACGLIWFLSNFGWADGGAVFGLLDMEDPNVNQMDYSILAYIGNFIAPIFAPLGFGNWQSTVASISGLVAKENVVGTFGVLFGLGDARRSGSRHVDRCRQYAALRRSQSSFFSPLTCCAPLALRPSALSSVKWPVRNGPRSPLVINVFWPIAWR